MTNTKWIPRARVYSEHDLFLSQARAFAVAAFFGAMLLVAASASRSSGEQSAPVEPDKLAGFAAVSEYISPQDYSAYAGYADSYNVGALFGDLGETVFPQHQHNQNESQLSPVRLNEIGDEVLAERTPLPLPPEPFASIPAKPEPSYYCECLEWLSEWACEKPRKIVAYHFVRLTLDNLGVPQHPNACGFLAAWYRLEAGKEFRWAERNHNPLGMKPGGDAAAYASAEEGAAVLADQLDGTLMVGGGERESRFSYPNIVRVLREAQNYESAFHMSRDQGVRDDLTQWCGCDHNRKNPYAKQLTYNIRAKLF